MSLDTILDGYLTLFRHSSPGYIARELARLSKSDPKLYALLQKKMRKGVDKPV